MVRKLILQMGRELFGFKIKLIAFGRRSRSRAARRGDAVWELGRERPQPKPRTQGCARQGESTEHTAVSHPSDFMGCFSFLNRLDHRL